MIIFIIDQFADQLIFLSTKCQKIKEACPLYFARTHDDNMITPKKFSLLSLSSSYLYDKKNKIK